MPPLQPDRIVILGAGGQLGGEFRQLLPTAAALDRIDADLTDADATRSALVQLRPQLVLNCAAFNHVDRAENEPALAFAVNALGVRNLAVVCRDLKARLVHFSTDAVFGLDRDRATPLSEEMLPRPVNVYGTSKLAGEYFVRACCPDHLVIRTCGLYGRRGHGGKGTNFVETILLKARLGEVLRVVDDQHCTPSSASDVAAATLDACRRGLTGLLHVTNGGECTWFEFAQAAVELAGLSATVVPISSAAWRARAPRPRYSVLSGERYRAAGLSPVPDWKEALRRYLQTS